MPISTTVGAIRIVIHVVADAAHVIFKSFRPLYEAGEKAGVARRVPANGFRCYASGAGVVRQVLDEGVYALHGQNSATWHRFRQVPIDLLIRQSTKKTIVGMESDFRHALLWHMEQDRTRPAELARTAGVSLDIIKKLRTRENSTTSAEVAQKIAAYYGKTLEQFMRREDAASQEATFAALVSLLTDAEREVLFRQVRGMIAGRD